MWEVFGIDITFIYDYNYLWNMCKLTKYTIK